jgi:hypothetical protein
MITAVSILEADPPCPVVSIGVARAAENLERPGDKNFLEKQFASRLLIEAEA